MKSFTYFAFVSLVFWIGACKETTTEQKSRAGLIKLEFQKGIDSLANLLDKKFLPMAEKSNSEEELARLFLELRKAYKQVEHLTEYFMPTTSRLLNGPPLDELEVEEHRAFEPGGLQVIEEFIFPEFDPSQRDELIREIKKMQRELRRITMLWEGMEFTEAHIFDALKLQVFRIITLGISGFDAPLSKNSMEEAVVSLSAIRRYLSFFDGQSKTNKTYQALIKNIENAEKYLMSNKDFDRFDRMEFITLHANPISSQILEYQKRIELHVFNETRALRADAKTLFEVNVFNPDFYAPDLDSYMKPEKIKLGEMLFYDPVLSGDQQRSCGSCHQPGKAFTDGLTKSLALDPTKNISRNAPTVVYAAFQKGQFYDMRALNLENQAVDVVRNKDEMHGSMEEAALLLQKDEKYLQLFKASYPKLKEIQPVHIQNALAAYVRSLSFFNSRFDRYMRGDKNQMNVQEIRGFNLFMGKAKCGICHFMPIFNGTVPPAYAKTESEVIGVPAQKNGKNVDSDLGKYLIHPMDQLKFAFKTPTVRNIELTAPYMHNGVYNTLEEVIEFYNKGGGNGLGMDLPNQTLPFEKLNLTEDEQKDLVVFMKTLTDVNLLKKQK